MDDHPDDIFAASQPAVEAAPAAQLPQPLRAVFNTPQVGTRAPSEDDDVAAAIRRLEIRDRAEEIHLANRAAASTAPKVSNLVDGAGWLFDDVEIEAPLWGTADDVLWQPGESLMVVGPIGVGKTTLAGLLVAGRMGLRDRVLGFPIVTDERPVLYLAMDRPKQARRALLRQLHPEDRELIADRLIVQLGPLVASMIDNPNILLELATKVGAGTVVVDSLKDVVLKLSDDAVAGAYNSARQLLMANGVELLELHHQKKANAAGGAPDSIGDIYGSVWLAAGAGSVVLLWGQTGDTVIELRHLKSPAGEVGPLKVMTDIDAGEMTIFSEITPLAVLAASPQLLAQDLAAMSHDDPTPSQVETARRKLKKLLMAGFAETFEVTPTRAGGKPPVAYKISELGREKQSRSNHGGGFVTKQSRDSRDSTRTPAFRASEQPRKQSRESRAEQSRIPPSLRRGIVIRTRRTTPGTGRN